MNLHLLLALRSRKISELLDHICERRRDVRLGLYRLRLLRQWAGRFSRG